MIPEISSAISSAKIALDIAKAANGLANYNDLVTAVSEVNTKLMEASVITLASLEKQSTLANRVTELENQLRDIENWEGTLKKYELHKFAIGSLAYVQNSSVQTSEPTHYICATCVNNRQKSILQPKGVNLHCNLCGSDIQIKNHIYVGHTRGL